MHLEVTNPKCENSFTRRLLANVMRFIMKISKRLLCNSRWPSTKNPSILMEDFYREHVQLLMHNYPNYGVIFCLPWNTLSQIDFHSETGFIRANNTKCNERLSHQLIKKSPERINLKAYRNRRLINFAFDMSAVRLNRCLQFVCNNFLCGTGACRK